ncbi:MAG: 4Fe-4S dicluster domain-containing protein [Polyangiaceae bacterium]
MSDVHVISRLCRDCVDGACVEVCPVDCIYEERPTADGGRTLPHQLFINPEDCTCCGACEPACPWEAIYPEEDLPPMFSDDVALNAMTRDAPERFDVAVKRLTERPGLDEVQANKRRWGCSEQADSRSGRA